jgi:hypothetical protein
MAGLLASVEAAGEFVHVRAANMRRLRALGKVAPSNADASA